MLLPTLTAQTTADMMTWTGDAKAFAYYAGPACRDEDRVATVYVARKRFEDGSTITIVLNVPRDGLEHLRASMLGEGRVERDPTGGVVSLDAYSQLRPHGGSYTYYEPIFGKNMAGAAWGSCTREPSPNPITLDQRRLRLDPKMDTLGGSWEKSGATASIVFSGSRFFWLDRLEAVAFGGTTALATGLRFADGFGPVSGRTFQTAGTTVLANDRGPYPVELAGQRLVFRRIDLISLNPVSGEATPAFAADSLLLRQDGGVAAYVPGASMPIGPSYVGWDGYVSGNNLPPDPTPPVALRGKLKAAWDQGMDARLDHLGQGGVFLPTSVPSDTSRTLMEQIGEKERPDPSPTPPTR